MATLLTYALCTVDDVEALLDDPTSVSEDLIKRKINQATEMIERYTGRRFKETTYTNEEYDATDTDQLILRQRPIITLSSVGLRDTSLNEDSFDSVDAENYFKDDNAGVIEGVFNFSGGWNRIRVTYTAGYSGTNWPDALPWDLREACATLAAYLVTNKFSSTGVKAKREGQRSIEYFESAGGSTIEQLGLDEILDSYSNYPVLYDK